MKDNYPRAYKEVLEILKYLPQESIDKIPKDIIDTFEHNKEKNYKFSIEESKSFEEQVLLDETKAILANIFRDYWATPKQKEIITNDQNYKRNLIEEEKKIKYNVDNIFENKENQSNEKEQEDNKTMIVYEEEMPLYKKIFLKIKKIIKGDL